MIPSDREQLEREMDDFTRPASMRHVCSLLLWILAMAPTAGCTGNVERQWSEEVALDDGSVIVVDRYVKFRESNSLAGDAYNSTSIKGTLGFTGEQAGLPKWDAPLTPIVLYRNVKSDEWVVVATTNNCDTWYERGSPVPMYWEFHLSRGKWIELRLSGASIGRKTNLFFDYEPLQPAKKLSIDMKTRVLKSKDFAKDFLSIGADFKTNCG